ncbi:MAG: hydroxymethylbilane synthase [Neisseriaceae bacterium]
MELIRIGTRSSSVALWQAQRVKQSLEKQGFPCQLVPIKAAGDLDLDRPLHQISQTGAFSRALDQALQEGYIDAAVHSMKDVPTELSLGIRQAAVLERGDPSDVLVYKGNLNFLEGQATIASGSLRRRAQWQARYPLHRMVDIRGNIQSRLEKLEENATWDGTLLSRAGLDRLGQVPRYLLTLDWMIPAPAQGAIVVTAREGDIKVQKVLSRLNHENTAFCVIQERLFLRNLEGGCSAPVGALVSLEGNQVFFRGGLFSLKGEQAVTVERLETRQKAYNLGERMAKEVLGRGGSEILAEIKRALR